MYRATLTDYDPNPLEPYPYSPRITVCRPVPVIDSDGLFAEMSRHAMGRETGAKDWTAPF